MDTDDNNPIEFLSVSLVPEIVQIKEEEPISVRVTRTRSKARGSISDNSKRN